MEKSKWVRVIQRDMEAKVLPNTIIFFPFCILPCSRVGAIESSQEDI